MKFIRYTTFPNAVVSFYLILFSVQIIAIEGMNISPVKVVAMAFSSLIFLSMLSNFNRNPQILLYVGLYLVVLSICSLLSSSIVVWDRLIYRGMFLMTFICVYQIVHTYDMPIESFLKLLIFIVCAYGSVFVMQQICFLIGIKELPLINLTGAMTMGGGLKANGLAIEPSHAGRILAFLYWGIIALTEMIKGREMSFMEHFKTNPWSTISFWYSMLFMGSATAMLGAMLVAIHFFKKNLWVYLFGCVLLIILLNIDLEIETLKRLQNVVNAFLSDDSVESLHKNEASGGSRIAPMINTITDLNLFSTETWIGKGSDNIRTNAAMFTTQKIGDINDFGLISYIVSLLFVFKFCIRRFFCIETLLFAILLGFSIGSLYTCWSAMIVCMAINYYETKYFKSTEVGTTKKSIYR